jgi:hypothetical protein
MSGVRVRQFSMTPASRQASTAVELPSSSISHAVLYT